MKGLKRKKSENLKKPFAQYCNGQWKNSAYGEQLVKKDYSNYENVKIKIVQPCNEILMNDLILY